MPDSLVSVIIPAFNQAPFLAEALESVLQQSYSHIEILLIDDGSTDGSPAIALTYAQKDPRLHYIRQENKGPAAARNLGITKSSGAYLCLLDGDDRMAPERIALQLKAFQDDPSIDIVFTALGIIDQEGNSLGIMRSLDYAYENFLPHLFFRNVIPGPSTIMAKKHCFVQNPYDETFIHAEDYELMVRLAHLYHFKYLNLPLTDYRRHKENLSNNLNAHRQAEIIVLARYSLEHIASTVNKSSLSTEEKTMLLGKIFFNLEHIEKALALFQGLAAPLASFYAGNCYAKLQKWNEGRRAYLEALRLDPLNAACHNNLGVLYALQEIDKAAFHFQQAVKLKSGYQDALFNLAHRDKPALMRWTWRELRPDLLPYS
ncbi:MAG: glycosyltransferase [Candidatus Protochlamydia sp.]|nr:glycosyltransferase [Candidatus Protochlamydia sp.]